MVPVRLCKEKEMKWLMRVLAAPPVREALRALAVALTVVLFGELAGPTQVVVPPPVLDGQLLGLSVS